jgi:hypothetical protein
LLSSSTVADQLGWSTRSTAKNLIRREIRPQQR